MGSEDMMRLRVAFMGCIGFSDIPRLCIYFYLHTHLHTKHTTQGHMGLMGAAHKNFFTMCYWDFETTISYVTDDAMAGMTGKISDAMSGDVCFLEKRGQLQDRLPFHF